MKRLGMKLMLLGCLILASFLFVLPTLAEDDVVDNVPDVVVVDSGDGVPTADILLWVQAGLLGLILGSVVYNGYQARGDAGVASAIDGFQADRKNVMTLETAYQNAPKQIQLAFNSATEAMFFLKNVTVLESSESLARLMMDIKTPGAPDPAPVEVVVGSSLDEATPSK